MNNRWEFLQAMMAANGGGIWKPYVYTTGELTLDNSTLVTIPFSVTLQDSKPFIWTDTLYATNNGTVQGGNDGLYGGLLLKFDEQGGFGQGGNAAFMSRSLVGNADLGPRELVFPLVFKGNETMSGSLTNVAGTTIKVRIDFIGLKRYA